MNRCIDKDIFRIISEVAEEKNIETYVIGGYVRDSFLGRTSPDIDIVCIGSGIFLANEVAGKIGKNIKVTVFKNFGTARIKYEGAEVEFVGARKESYSYDSRKPIVENGSLQEDLNRRDFTINSLGLSLNKINFGKLIDSFNGVNDLNNKIIRTPLDPDKTFSDDPLRMLRAIRFANQLDFKISDITFEAIKKNKNRLSIVSAERILEELNKIINCPVPSKGFYLLDKSGLLELILPELISLKGFDIIDNIAHKDVFKHTLKVLDNISKKSDNLWLRWAGLLHDIGKPATRHFNKEHGWTFHGHNEIGSRMVTDIFQRLKLPLNEKMKYVKKIVSLHMRPIVLAQEVVTDSAIRRLLFEAGDDIDELMLLCEADITSKSRFKVIKYKNNFSLVRQKLIEIEEKDRLRNWQPPINGDDIMRSFGISQSKEVGIIKNLIKEAILDGKINNDREEAIKYMKKLGKELGLKLKMEN